MSAIYQLKLRAEANVEEVIADPSSSSIHEVIADPVALSTRSKDFR
jgi:hypothetical protein